MKVSFLVTYYNQEHFVKESLDSILAINKSYDWEILVGDDGSSDGTVQMVQTYIDRYPEHISCYVMDREPGKKYEVVRRASVNRLNLLKHMTGEYFCLIDGDDFYCDVSFVEEALRIYSENPELSVVAFGYQKYSALEGILSTHTLPNGLVDISAYLAEKYTHAGACVYKAVTTCERLAFLQKVGYYDDNDILINQLQFGGMYAVDRVVYSYRQADSSVYNSMTAAEQAVLNSQGYDVDIQYIDGYGDELLYRYSAALLTTYFLRKQLKFLLGEKWSRYTDGCQQIDNSITYLILTWDTQSKQNQKKISQLIWRCIKARPRMALRLWVEACLSGIKTGR